MRTTVILDPDVERLLKATMREKGVTFKQALNDAVRAGHGRAALRRKKRFAQRTFAMGNQRHFRWDKALAAADAMEGEELIRKCSLRR